eukprot:TRINITY_DN12124_c2_g1_i2.p1 TRINITY_DN12124_c2_g1~~TRINITY_DN12124_c2_g1_i2.p1  ORF type:complete len:111 (-),score=10.03 TRINITY_DN12124_c2_g1_i2:32-364(-)
MQLLVHGIVLRVSILFLLVEECGKVKKIYIERDKLFKFSGNYILVSIGLCLRWMGFHLKGFPQERASSLEDQFTKEEIEQAVFDLGGNCALGPDGFSHCALPAFLGSFRR